MGVEDRRRLYEKMDHPTADADLADKTPSAIIADAFQHYTGEDWEPREVAEDAQELIQRKHALQKEMLQYYSQESAALGRNADQITISLKKITELLDRSGINSNPQNKEFPDRETYPDTAVYRVLENIIQRIKAETEVSSEIEEMLPLEALLDLEEYTKDKPNIKTNITSKLGASGRQRGGTVSVDIEGRENHPRQVLYWLSLGKIMNNFTVLFHELVHVQQMPEAKTIFKNLLAIFTHGYNAADQMLMHRQVLKEVHADRRSQPLSGSTGKKMSSLLANFSFVRGQEQFTKVGQYQDQIFIGAQAVDRLRALGFSNKEIGRLVSSAKWDEQALGYDTLEAAIEQRRTERGLSIEQVDSLVDLKRIQRDIDQMQISKITFEEIDKALAE